MVNLRRRLRRPVQVEEGKELEPRQKVTAGHWLDFYDENIFQVLSKSFAWLT